jgi:adenylate kinase
MTNSQIYLLSGTPGTGKTTIAKILEEEFGYLRISLGEEVLNHNLYSETDIQRDSKIVDETKLQMFVQKRLLNLAQPVIIEAHYADMVVDPRIKLALILRCHPNTLKSRLKAREYSESKVIENIQAELVGDSTAYMLEHPHLTKSENIFEIDSSVKLPQELAGLIREIIQDPRKFPQLIAGKISWLSDPTVDVTKYL